MCCLAVTLATMMERPAAVRQHKSSLLLDSTGSAAAAVAAFGNTGQLAAPDEQVLGVPPARGRL
jgi:hypothetical protein